MGRQRDTVTLPAELAEELRRQAAESAMTPDALAADLIRERLAAGERPEPDLALAPVLHVADLAAAIEFYLLLGAEIARGSRDGDWVQLAIGDARLGLRTEPADPDGTAPAPVELNFEASEPLAVVADRLRAAGLPVTRPTAAGARADRLRLSTPDGVPVTITAPESDLYA